MVRNKVQDINGKLHIISEKMRDPAEVCHNRQLGKDFQAQLEKWSMIARERYAIEIQNSMVEAR